MFLNAGLLQASGGTGEFGCEKSWMTHEFRYTFRKGNESCGQVCRCHAAGKLEANEVLRPACVRLGQFAVEAE